MAYERDAMCNMVAAGQPRIKFLKEYYTDRESIIYTHTDFSLHTVTCIYYTTCLVTMTSFKLLGDLCKKAKGTNNLPAKS